MSLNVVIGCVAIGGWYSRGVARMVNAFNEVSYGFTIKAWVNIVPPGAPESVIVDGYDYTAYCAKPFAMKALMDSGADIGILMDVSFYPIRHIAPLVEHIAEHGYYLCDNGAKVGEWSTDAALEEFDLSREDAMGITEVSSYCVGLDFQKADSRSLARDWPNFTRLVPGPHTSDLSPHAGRNRGFVAHNPRVLGHRHDQTTLSLLVNDFGMNNLTARPKFTAYKGSEDGSTVLVNEGMGS